MKFLCVPCDSPMRLQATQESEPGSLAVVYSCPQCGYEMAMLTNAQETQMVRSLGVRIGPARPESGAAAIAAPGEPAAASGKCPFSAMLPAHEASRESPAWTPEALARLDSIPEMVRPMARAGIEMVAKEGGHEVIDEAVLSAARARFGM
jgi:predicted RNA-binding Zn-ribbon protein involved in translation (DUF1610 family)